MAHGSHKHANTTWILPDTCNWEQVNAAILMDIREELRSINSYIRCYRVPRALDTIQRLDKRLAKKFGPLKTRKRK